MVLESVSCQENDMKWNISEMFRLKLNFVWNLCAISCSNKYRSKDFKQMEIEWSSCFTNYILQYLQYHTPFTRTQTINNQISVVRVFTRRFDEFSFVNNMENVAFHNFQHFTLWTTNWTFRKKLDLNVIEHRNILRKRNIRSVNR